MRNLHARNFNDSYLLGTFFQMWYRIINLLWTGILPLDQTLFLPQVAKFVSGQYIGQIRSRKVK